MTYLATVYYRTRKAWTVDIDADTAAFVRRLFRRTQRVDVVKQHQ